MWLLAKYPFINLLCISELATLKHLLPLKLPNLIDFLLCKSVSLQQVRESFRKYTFLLVSIDDCGGYLNSILLECRAMSRPGLGSITFKYNALPLHYI